MIVLTIILNESDIRLADFLELDPSGLHTFAGQRALLFDAVALGLLRRELIETTGLHIARGILTRFGYAHGWRTAEHVREAIPWADTRSWQRAGGRLHRLWGHVSFEAVAESGGECPPFAEARWPDSYEAEQHILHLGQARDPVCWTLCGFASGYLSRAHGRRIIALERHCCGRGDAVCLMHARALEDWGEEERNQLVYYEAGLDEGLERLRDVEQSYVHAQFPRASPEEDELRDPVMRRVVELARRVARVDSTVLIRGESGSGKERLARMIHASSARVGGPFLALNCAALPETMIDAELFGHVRGAFTGASRARPGLFEAAHGGTLLLDEVGELSPATQARLLRVVQEREVRRIGENQARPVNVRLLAATHRDLVAEVAAGRFREDLLYRLRVVEIVVPPLRERPGDILPIARALLAQLATRLDRPVRKFAPSACQALLRHTWPGNVRELANAIEHGVALAGGTELTAQDLPETVRGGAVASPEPSPVPSRRTLAELEREHILATLQHAQGDRSEAARRLGIGIATLYRRLKRYRDEGAADSQTATLAPK